MGNNKEDGPSEGSGQEVRQQSVEVEEEEEVESEVEEEEEVGSEVEKGAEEERD